MTSNLKASLLEKLERLKGNSPKVGADPTGHRAPSAELSGTPTNSIPEPAQPTVPTHGGAAEADPKLDEMLSRIHGLARGSDRIQGGGLSDSVSGGIGPGGIASEPRAESSDTTPAEENHTVAASETDTHVYGLNTKDTRNENSPTVGTLSGSGEFFPAEPDTLAEAGLSESAVEELMLKHLLSVGEESGHGISDQIKLPYKLIAGILSRMKYDQLISYRSTTKLNDYICTLTDSGRERARRHSDRCTYFGSAPVSLKAYCQSVARQSLTLQTPGESDLRRAFADLMISSKMLLRLGAAMNSGKGMFLFGGPGNGKTSIAERVTKAFGEAIWIPRAIGIDGEIIRVFDPTQHEPMPLPPGDDLLNRHKVDARWIRIRRPTIIVGGELTMSNLELSTNLASGINEAPVQLKSNCGTLVIDDFGRQRMSVTELLNRWIVPLEKRIDYLNLPSGKKVQVPFDQLVVFSTNLEPRDLVDDAFLRRIPYKIEVANPTEAEYRDLFALMCGKMNIALDQDALDYLIDHHYKAQNRPYRCCQPRDLLLQIKSITSFQQRPVVMTRENFDAAADSYFSVM